MEIRELDIPDAYEISTKQFSDDRGLFLEWYRFDKLEEVAGRRVDLRQANLSVSKRGVLRGIHFADIPPSQAKYVVCPQGAVLDFVVDIRVGSPTFGKWDSVLLDDIDRRGIFISEGLGHAFVALTDNAVVNYLVTDVYRPGAEHGINPLDENIALTFPAVVDDLILSDKDEAAPTLAEAAEQGLLPDYRAAKEFYASLGGAK